MPTINFGGLDSNEDVEEQLAEVQKVLTWLLNGRLDTLNIRELTADKIITGTLLAQLVTIKSAIGSGAEITLDGTGLKITYLSGVSITFDEDGMRINNGLQDVFVASKTGQVTMIGAQVQSAAGSYPRVEMSSSEKIFAAYNDLNDWVKIEPSIMGTAALMFKSGTAEAQQFLFNSGVGGYYYYIQSTGNIEIKPGTGKYLTVPSASNVLFNGTSLQEMIDDLQDQIDDLKSGTP